jgi:hypothetical protein
MDKSMQKKEFLWADIAKKKTACVLQPVHCRGILNEYY